MKKKTLIVNYFGMGTGGIETYIATLMRYAVSQGHRVIWFTNDGVPQNAKQKDIVGNPKIEMILFAVGRRKFFHNSPNLHLTEDEDVVMISFVPEDYMWAEQFRYKYKCRTFYHHLILMNFFGWLTYPEDEFKIKFLSKQRAKLSNKFAHQAEKKHVIRAFADKQLEAYKERYNLSYDVSQDLLLKSFPVDDGLTKLDLQHKAETRKDEFVIVTCARFQFPHKGYLLGLLDEYEKIKNKYSNTKLIVIGDGEKETFLKKFNKMPETVKESICITGTLEFDEVINQYKNSHLVIGLAGSISASAARTLPSLVVRHDTLNCETYGFYQDVESTLKSEPGKDIISFIEHSISCSNDDYVELGLTAAEEYNRRVIIDPDYIFNETNEDSRPIVSKCDWRRNRIWVAISILKKYFKFL